MNDEKKIRQLKIEYLKALARGDKTRAAQLENEIEDNMVAYAHELNTGEVVKCQPGQGIGIKGSLLKQLDEENKC